MRAQAAGAEEGARSSGVQHKMYGTEMLRRCREQQNPLPNRAIVVGRIVEEHFAGFTIERIMRVWVSE